MPLYDFRCSNEECRSEYEIEFRMDDSEGRAAAVCMNCNCPLGRSSYATVKIPAGWNNFTYNDILPAEIKGAGPHSKAARDYGERTYAKFSENNRLRTSYNAKGQIIRRQDGSPP